MNIKFFSNLWIEWIFHKYLLDPWVALPSIAPPPTAELLTDFMLQSDWWKLFLKSHKHFCFPCVKCRTNFVCERKSILIMDVKYSEGVINAILAQTYRNANTLVCIVVKNVLDELLLNMTSHCFASNSWR